MGWVRRIRDWGALRLWAACLLGVPAVGVLLCTSAVPAAAESGARPAASCVTTHQNVEGDDNGPGQTAYGNQAMIATNNQGTLNGTRRKCRGVCSSGSAPATTSKSAGPQAGHP
ncbi:MAG TPA: hypothetical protein VGS19_20620 [Streptosporangiaceae bacterium]|nr:hypothetical protein [Streptosporangiaceae bacterium]